jgi:hypothetical protein
MESSSTVNYSLRRTSKIENPKCPRYRAAARSTMGSMRGQLPLKYSHSHVRGVEWSRDFLFDWTKKRRRKRLMATVMACIHLCSGECLGGSQ